MTFRICKVVSEPGILRYDAGTAAAGALRCMAYGAGVFVRVGAGGSVETSVDGVTGWTSRTSNTVNMLNGVVWVPWVSLFIAVGNTGTIITSPDGVTEWTVRTSGTTNNLNSVTHNGTDRVVIVGASGTHSNSSNGTSWSTTTSTYPVLSWNSIIHTGTQYIVAASAFGGGPENIIHSTDGTSWTPQQPSGTANLLSAIWTGTRAVLVGSQGKIYTNNGASSTTWTQRRSGFASQSLRIFEGNGYLYCVDAGGVDGASLVSTDGGLTWNDGPSVGTATGLRYGFPDPLNPIRALVVGDSGVTLAGQYGARVKSYASNAARIANTPNGQSPAFAYADQPATLTVSSL